MEKLSSFIFIMTLFIANTAWACPGCAGSMDNSKYEYTVYILMTFIALTYIPFFILYKTIWKYRKSELPSDRIPS
jgi:hypothetical protein